MNMRLHSRAAGKGDATAHRAAGEWDRAAHRAAGKGHTALKFCKTVST